MLVNCYLCSRDFYEQAAAHDRAVGPFATLTVSAISLALLLLQSPIRGATVGERHHTAICRPRTCVPALHHIVQLQTCDIDATAFSSIRRCGQPPIHFAAGHKRIPAFRQVRRSSTALWLLLCDAHATRIARFSRRCADRDPRVIHCRFGLWPVAPGAPLRPGLRLLQGLFVRQR